MTEGKYAITGLGMISPVGHDVKTACASIRCGMSRPKTLFDYAVQVEGEFEAVPVIGYPLAGITNGYKGFSLLARIGIETVHDLLNYSKLTANNFHFWENTGLFLSVSEIRNGEYSFLDEIIENELPSLILSSTGLPIKKEACRVFPIGHAGVLFAIEEAQSMLDHKQLERIIIMGVDSLVGRDELNAMAGRLKSDSNENGFIPGETGAAVMIERIDAAHRRTAFIEGFIGKIETGYEDHNRMQEEPVKGNALSEVITKVAEQNKIIHLMISDLNGEQTRALEWGMAVPRIRTRVDISESIMWLPAISIGDTGAASGAVAICMAIRSFMRGYANSHDIVIWSSSDSGEVGAASLHQNF